MANEGRFVAFVAQRDAERALALLHGHKQGAEASLIGRATERDAGLVVLEGRIGAARLVDMLSGEQLPRIC